jgi:hypothetical protein
MLNLVVHIVTTGFDPFQNLTWCPQAHKATRITSQATYHWGRTGIASAAPRSRTCTSLSSQAGLLLCIASRTKWLPVLLAAHWPLNTVPVPYYMPVLSTVTTAQVHPPYGEWKNTKAFFIWQSHLSRPSNSQTRNRSLFSAPTKWTTFRGYRTLKTCLI